MIHPNSVYAALLLASAILSAFVSGLILRRRSAPGAAELIVVLLGSMVWSLAYAMFWIAVSPEVKRFWLDVTYFGVVSTPTAMFLFVLQYVRRSGWFRGWRAALFAVEPAITLALLWTNPMHGLFYRDGRLLD